MTNGGDNKMNTLPTGFFTVVYPEHKTHRTLQFKRVKRGGLAGKVIVGYLNGTDNTSDYEFFGFLLPNGHVAFWQKFTAKTDNTRLERIVKAVTRILTDTVGAGKAYALASGNCYCCNRMLTNPESIELGIGPECRKKR